MHDFLKHIYDSRTISGKDKNIFLKEIYDFLQNIDGFLKKIGQCRLHRVKCGHTPTALRNDAKAPYPYPVGGAAGTGWVRPTHLT